MLVQSHSTSHRLVVVVEVLVAAQAVVVSAVVAVTRVESAKCTQLHVQNVARNVRFLSVQMAQSQFIAATASSVTKRLATEVQRTMVCSNALALIAKSAHALKSLHLLHLVQLQLLHLQKSLSSKLSSISCTLSSTAFSNSFLQQW